MDMINHLHETPKIGTVNSVDFDKSPLNVFMFPGIVLACLFMGISFQVSEYYGPSITETQSNDDCSFRRYVLFCFDTVFFGFLGTCRISNVCWNSLSCFKVRSKELKFVGLLPDRRKC